MRKNIPVQDGGALENKNIKKYENNNFDKNNLNPFKLSDLIILLIRIFELSINFLSFPNLYSNSLSKIKFIIKKIKFNFIKRNSSYFSIQSKQPSYMLTKYLLDEKYLIKISQKRIENYRILFNKIKRITFNKSVFDLSKHSVPQFFPILLNNKNRTLFNFLNNNGIETIKWPSKEIPEDILKDKINFPNSNYLNENLILIPVHQCLSKKNINKIINTIHSFSKDNI